MSPAQPKKIVLAYSGGLDTSVILPWLKDRYPGVKLVAFAAELGQGDELKGIEDKACKSGADEVVIKDLRQRVRRAVLLPDAAGASGLRNRLSAGHQHRPADHRQAPGGGRPARPAPTPSATARPARGTTRSASS